MKRLMIDIGHGGSDPGACANGLVEKDENLKKGQALKQQLEQYEIDIKLTRASDVSLLPDDRVKIVNDFNPDLCVSIHHNAYNKVARGVEVVHAYYNKTDDRLGADIVKRISELGMPARRSFAELNALGKDRLYMIRRIWDNDTDAILVECGFLDNTEDAALLKSASFVNAEVKAIADAIVEYMKLQPKKTDKAEVKKPEHWGIPFIEELKKRGLITGSHDADAPITWAEFSKVIVTLLNVFDKKQ